MPYLFVIVFIALKIFIIILRLNSTKIIKANQDGVHNFEGHLNIYQEEDKEYNRAIIHEVENEITFLAVNKNYRAANKNFLFTVKCWAVNKNFRVVNNGPIVFFIFFLINI